MSIYNPKKRWALKYSYTNHYIDILALNFTYDENMCYSFSEQ